MNLIHHENTFVRREAILDYGGFCEDKSQNVEYRIWLRMIRDHAPMIVNDEFTVFIIHKGSTSTGNLWQFSKAIGRAFNTQNVEKVVPLLGYYGDSEFLENSGILYQNVRKRILSFLDSF